jgi:uncharacterized membrane protein YagU involved in acid resistance
VLKEIQKDGAYKTIIIAWLVAGTADICAAMLLYYLRTGNNPSAVLQYITSAVIDTTAYTRSMAINIAGLLLHYIIALLFVTLLFILYPVMHRLFNNRVCWAAVYGLFIWAIMNLLVLPLTRLPAQPIQPLKALQGILVLVLAIGLPASFIIHRYYYGKKS